MFEFNQTEDYRCRSRFVRRCVHPLFSMIRRHLEFMPMSRSWCLCSAPRQCDQPRNDLWNVTEKQNQETAQSLGFTAVRCSVSGRKRQIVAITTIKRTNRVRENEWYCAPLVSFRAFLGWSHCRGALHKHHERAMGMNSKWRRINKNNGSTYLRTNHERRIIFILIGLKHH